MEFITQFIVAVFATLAFAILFSAPRSQLWFCGFTGALGWIVYYILVANEFSVVFASFKDGKAIFTTLHEGDFIISEPGIAHNEILSSGAVIHTLKYGDCAQPDWIPCPELDRLTKHLTFEEALSL